MNARHRVSVIVDPLARNCYASSSMKRFAAVLIAVSLNAWSLAQTPLPPGATPKKDPFAGFGTSLDQRPGKPASGSSSLLPPRPSPSNAPSAPPASDPGSLTGIVLSKEWSGHLTEGAGGQTMKMNDLQALLSGYGQADRDIDPHPDVTVYEGAPFDPSLGQTCRITYLMPLVQAEKLLFRSRGIVTGGRVVAPGFPDGLFVQIYEIRAGIYNHLFILTDVAQHVISLELKAEGVNYYPPAPFTKLDRNWHTHDYLNTQNKGQPGLQIDTRVNDLRSRGRYIIVNMTGGSLPGPQIQQPVVIKPARSSPKETSTWYVPEPMVSLILYTLGKQLGAEIPGKSLQSK
jgi:hypothetical protein